MESAFDDEKGLSVIVEPQHRSGSSATLVVDRQPESSTGLEMAASSFRLSDLPTRRPARRSARRRR